MLPEHEGARVMAARRGVEAEAQARHRGFLQDLRESAPTPTHHPEGSMGIPRRGVAGAVVVVALALMTWMAQDGDAQTPSAAATLPGAPRLTYMWSPDRAAHATPDVLMDVGVRERRVER